jgi:ATP-dependent DNA helicase DinG
VVRAKLAQAFGRLIRRQGDRGQFVVLSNAFPSRLLTAFPPDVAVRRMPFDEVLWTVASAGQRGNEAIAQVDQSFVIDP